MFIRTKFLPVLIMMVLTFHYSSVYAQSCWSEVWSDNFDGTTLNTANWNYDLGTGCPSLCGWGNNEKQYYTSDPQNISVSGGLLTITARYSANHLGSGYNFTSAKIQSRNKQYWKYGRFEARMKMPVGMGTWPAFWMLPQSSPYGNWPTSGEIDVMEYRGDLTSKIDGTLHYGNAWPNNQYDGSPYTLSSGTFASDFHIFSTEWDESTIRWYVDGILFKTETKTPNSLNPASNNAVNWPWDQDFYLIVNLALGGWYAGNPTDFQVYGGNTAWTAELQVDYIKVYTDLSGGALTGSVAGKSSVLPNETSISYSIASTALATYAWTVPSGASIISGQGTESILVNWGTASGNVSVVKTIGCGSANYSMPVTVMPNTCGKMLEDFENIRFTNYGFINGQFTPKVVNPASSVENTSPFCSQYIRNPSEQYDVLIVTNPGIGNADLIENGSKRFMFDIYSNGPGRVVEITLEDNTVANSGNYPWGRHSTYRATTTKTNEWETLTFVLVSSPDPGLPGVNVNQIVMLFSPNTNTNTTFYFDNILLDETPTPPTINGVNTVCANQNGVAFNVTNVSGNTYNWTVPGDATLVSGQTTNAITVNFVTPGNITVTPSNASGCAGALVTKTITTTPAPTNPTITGLSSVCTNQTAVTYSIPVISGSTYTWTAPADATIATGQGTNAITVNYGVSSGSIGVNTTSSNGCPGTTSSLVISNNVCTSVHDPSFDGNTTYLFPNPASDFIKVSLGNNLTGADIKVKIMENTGKVISETIYQSSSTSELFVPITQLKNGQYLIQLSNGTTNTVKAFVKR